ncbi:MAG: hypothetical protein HY549_10410 [Elusimicrobia bacterium]|nr:hypothetical protein [Elusimicrobiota bacterium]
MELSGWDIDLRSVYGWFSWRKRSRFHWRESLFESPDRSCGLLFFAIGEVGVNKQVARIALFRDKTAPRRAWHSGRTLFWFEGPAEPVIFSADGRTAIVWEFLQGWGGTLGSRQRVLDLQARRLLPF